MTILKKALAGASIIAMSTISSNAYAQSSAVSVPALIEAEDFVGFNDADPQNRGGAGRNTAVDLQNCNDPGCGLNVGWTNGGEWLEYEINVNNPGEYTAALRLASRRTNRTMSIDVDGQNRTGNFTIDNTGNWQNYYTETVELGDLSAGNHTVRVNFEDGGVNFNWIELDGGSSTNSGSAVTVPARLEAENFVNFNDSDPQNRGNAGPDTAVDVQPCSDQQGCGFNVGWTSSGEWLEYEINVDTPGEYTADLRLASRQTGRQMSIDVDGQNRTGNFTIDNTGNWQSYYTETVELGNLSAGTHTVRVNFEDGGVNFNYFDMNSTNGPAFGIGPNGTPFCSPNYSGDITLGGETPPLSYGYEDVDFDGIFQSCLVQGGDGSSLTHFGQPVTLVGANIPWTNVDGDSFSRNFGLQGANQSAITNSFRNSFNDIASNGGNSARIWLHTTAQFTPIINSGGFVQSFSELGINGNLNEDLAIGQIRDVLDAAWDEGILVTFSLFSFDMLCDNQANGFGNGTNDFIAHQSFLSNQNGQIQSYLDNALLPMVEGLRGHPALFAWEVFNEPEGMIQGFSDAPGGNFCQNAELTHSTNITAVQEFAAQIARAIHNADSDVKVTTSTTTDFIEYFTNDRLREVTGIQGRLLDFYELHWYAFSQEFPHLNPPFLEGPEAYTNVNIDVPIVIGEYDVNHAGITLFGGDNPAPNRSGNGSRRSIADIIDRGYAGAWPWSLTTESNTNRGRILEAIDEARRPLTQAQRNAICNATDHEACGN